ncbi:MAG TPA: hypothetical protein VMU70_02520 [Candidatus Tyrphobacter sp.]|nr:hypothetical protein [Candidatus Tyrphobacter sp.]
MKKSTNKRKTKVIKKTFSISDVGVLIEDFEKQLGLVAEGVVSLDQKLDRTSAMIENRICSLDKKVDSLDQKIDRVAAELKEFVRSEIETLRIEIKSIEKNKASFVEVAELEKRVSALERLVGKRTRT